MKRSLTRRGFLKCLAATAAVVAAEPVIEKVQIFVPPTYEARPTFHPDAFRLEVPEKIVFLDPGRFPTNKDPLSIRYVREYDINSDRFPVRLDVLYGMSVLQPNLVARISSVE